MPILPLIDLLILLAWTILMLAVVQKALWMAVAARFTILGLTPYDLLLVAGTCLLFALALAARVWVKAHEPQLLRQGRRHPAEVLPDFPDPRDSDTMLADSKPPQAPERATG